MAQAMRSCMREETGAFEVDAALAGVRVATEDKTAADIAAVLWFACSDCNDHTIVASKEEWDWLNRLLLLLESDAELEVTRAGWRWHPVQAVAAMLLAAFLAIGCRVGFGQHLMAYALPFGPVSMLLAWVNSRRMDRQTTVVESALTPFPSVASLLSVRRQVAGFARAMYPKCLGGRRTRDRFIERLMWILWSMAWCMFSPVALFFQMLPKRRLETRIKTPVGTAGG